MRRKVEARSKGPGAIDLMEQSVSVLRRAPAPVLASYFIGTLPFILGLLYFWTDMSRSPFAQRHLPEAAVGMVVLYAWMKAWQGAFAARLMAHLAGDPAPQFTLPRAARMTAVQAAWQPFSLFALPIALILFLPFGWVYAWFHNLSVTGDGEEAGFREPARKAWSMASLWSTQNHTAIALCWLLWGVVYLNIATLFAFLPEVIRMLTGVESAFTMSGASLMNTTFYAVVAGVTHLCVNPMIKAVYVLRCFWGESLHSGADLKAELNSVQRESTGSRVALALVAALLCCLASSPGSAAEIAKGPASIESKVSPKDLSNSIERVINKREYQWRTPRSKDDINQDRGAIVEFLQGIRDWVVKVTKPLRDLWVQFRDWLRRLMNPDRSDEVPGRAALTEEQTTLLLILLAVASVVLGLFLWRVWRRKKQTAEVLAQPVAVLPDLKDENLVATQLPEEEWQALAADFMAKGELRLAMRALYMASLAFLAGRSLITIARFKSNRDYQRELLRRAREKEPLLQAFSENVSLFERSWYGAHEVTRQLMETFDINHDRIRTFAQE